MVLVHSHRCTHTHRHTHLCLALSLSKQPFYSERLHWSGSAPAKTPFHTSSLPFSKPSLLCDRRAFLPSFLPPDTEAWGSRRGVRMAGCAPIEQTDRLTSNRNADRRMLLLLWTLDSDFFPSGAIRRMTSFLFFVGQQEGGGRLRTAECVGESMKEYEETKGNWSVDQRRGRAMTMPVEVHLTCMKLWCTPKNVFIFRDILYVVSPLFSPFSFWIQSSNKISKVN